MTQSYVQICAGTATVLCPTKLATDPTTPLDQVAPDFPGNDTVNSDQEDEAIRPLQSPTGYDKFELLSEIYDAIIGQPHELPEHLKSMTQSPGCELAKIAAHKENASFVSGVDNLATAAYLGKNISRNLFGILEALSRGCDDITIVGHSRGAVAAILITHVLNAIKNAPTDKTLLTILSECKNLYIEKEIKLHEAWLKEHGQAIIDRIRGNHQQGIAPATFSLFAIDPVPGNGGYGTTWDDERMFTIPAIISEAEIVIKEDERTGGFRVCIPHAENPRLTKLKITPFPGHHGTAPGNLQDQPRSEAFKDKIKQTKHVQKLVNCKITDYLLRHGILFRHRHLNVFRQDPKQQLKLYNKILENRDTYKTFRQSTYNGFLGKEDQQGDRVVCTANINTGVSLGSQIAQIPGYVNYEHLLLELKTKFTDIQESEPPIAVLRYFNEKLANADENFVANFSKASALAPDYFAHIFSGLINTISLSYLQNNLLPETKKELVHAVTDLIQLLKKHEAKTWFGSACAEAQKSLVSTIQQRLDANTEEIDALKNAFKSLKENPNTTLEASLLEKQYALREQYHESYQGLIYLQNQLQQKGIEIEADMFMAQPFLCIKNIRSLLQDLNGDTVNDPTDLYICAAARGDLTGMKIIETNDHIKPTEKALDTMRALHRAIDANQTQVIDAYFHKLTQTQQMDLFGYSLTKRLSSCFESIRTKLGEKVELINEWFQKHITNLNIDKDCFNTVLTLYGHVFPQRIPAKLVNQFTACHDPMTLCKEALETFTQTGKAYLKHRRSLNVDDAAIITDFLHMFPSTNASKHPAALFEHFLTIQKEVHLPCQKEWLLAHQTSFLSTIKSQTITLLVAEAENGASTPMETFFSLQQQLGQKTMALLTINNQSTCEFTLKILACCTLFFGVILALKRLYDSSGRSANFFKPLAEQTVCGTNVSNVAWLANMG